MENYCKPPKRTLYERTLKKILDKKGVPAKPNQVIWYTSCDCFTPDLIIGKRLIIEVDGKIHDTEHRKTLDRIRKRALENMGYIVRIVRNEQVRDKPDKIAEDIKELYFQLSDTENKKVSLITELKRPSEIEPIPRGLIIEQWVQKLNQKLDNDVEKWSIDQIKESLSRFPPELVKNQCAMEKFILSLHGYKLRKTEDGNNLDFKYSLKFFKKSLDLLNDLFPKSSNMTTIHLKNMFNESAPGFFKNLVFKGGPNLNEGIVSIENEYSLNFHIDNFNKYLSELEITVERSDIIQECKAKLQKISQEEKSNYNWLVTWMNID